MAAILNLSQKRHLPLVDFGGLFNLDIWYPKEHVSSEMAFITFFSNQNLLFTGLLCLYRFSGDMLKEKPFEILNNVVLASGLNGRLDQINPGNQYTIGA